MILLIINPGSTSTKISLFRDREMLFTESLFHDAPELMRYADVNDQVPFRKGVILDFLAKHGYRPEQVDVFVGRGGSAYPQQGGVIGIDTRLYEDTKNAVGKSDHPAKLGVMLAYELQREYGGKMFTLNATNVDELVDEARLTGISGLYRRAQTHVLNQKAVAAHHARRLSGRYEDFNFIVSHIDGGITVTAHEKGRMIDSTEGAGGDGPFTPTRLGSIPVLEVLQYLETHTIEEMRAMCSRSGGLVTYFGTSDADRIHALVDAGDEKAVLVWRAMTYQICKSVGAMAAALKGRVDAILLTGGLVRFADIGEAVRERCGFIAPVVCYPGEMEQEALCFAVCDALEGKAPIRTYTGAPVWTPPDW